MRESGCFIVILIFVVFPVLTALVFRPDALIDSADMDKVEIYMEKPVNIDSMCHYLALCVENEEKEDLNYWQATLFQFILSDRGYGEGCAVNENEYLKRCNNLIEQTENWLFKSKSIWLQAEYFGKKWHLNYIKYYRGKFKIRKGDYYGAISDLNEVLEDIIFTNSDLEGKAYLELGRAYWKLNDESKACENWSAGVDYSDVGNTCLELIKENCNSQK